MPDRGRGGGNVHRERRRPPEPAVLVEPRTMLNLLKSLPGLFGDVASEQIRDLHPAIIFDQAGIFRCWFDAADITKLGVHKKLAADKTQKLDRVVRAYIADTDDGKRLYPSLPDLGREGQLADRLDKLRTDFAGRAAVDVGGVIVEGEITDFTTTVLRVSELLHDAHKRGLGYVATQDMLRGALVILTEQPAVG